MKFLPAPAQSGSLATAASSGPPAVVERGILDLLIAFPAGAPMERKERVRQLQLYAEAVEGFHPAVSARALKHLRLHNPRNTPTFTQPPTAQDVYELCAKIEGEWRWDVIRHFLGEPDMYRTVRVSIFDTSPPIPKPLEPGCVVPDDLVLSILKRELAREHRHRDLVELEIEKFDAIPREAFEPGHRERILSERAERAAREEAARKEREYLASLPADLRAARHDELSECWRRGESWSGSEDELIARAKQRLERAENERIARSNSRDEEMGGIGGRRRPRTPALEGASDEAAAA